MGRVVFLLEEYSMKVLLEQLLPRLFPGLAFQCIPHAGKQDLEKSLPRKLRAWNVPGDRFIVVRDSDGGDCRELKRRLRTLCSQSGGREDVLVRIVCQELESWYLGDSEALAAAFSRKALVRTLRGSHYREPDAVQQPSAVLERLVPEFQKVSGARQMGRFLTRERNSSKSFRALLTGIDQLVVEMGN